MKKKISQIPIERDFFQLPHEKHPIFGVGIFPKINVFKMRLLTDSFRIFFITKLTKSNRQSFKQIHKKSFCIPQSNFKECIIFCRNKISIPVKLIKKIKITKETTRIHNNSLHLRTSYSPNFESLILSISQQFCCNIVGTISISCAEERKKKMNKETPRFILITNSFRTTDSFYFSFLFFHILTQIIFFIELKPIGNSEFLHSILPS